MATLEGNKLIVSPDEYTKLKQLANATDRTINGKINESLWLTGLVSLFGTELCRQMFAQQPIEVVVSYEVKDAT